MQTRRYQRARALNSVTKRSVAQRRKIHQYTRIFATVMPSPSTGSEEYGYTLAAPRIYNGRRCPRMLSGARKIAIVEKANKRLVYRILGAGRAVNRFSLSLGTDEIRRLENKNTFLSVRRFLNCIGDANCSLTTKAGNLRLSNKGIAVLQRKNISSAIAFRS